MKVLAACVALAGLTALLLGGTAPFGRVFLSLGWPSLAALAFSDMAWRGAAHYRSGDMDLASDAFRTAKSYHNLGNALAHQGSYARALEAYDQAIAQGDQDARANFDLVSSFYGGMGIDPDAFAALPKRKSGPEMESSIGQGDGRAAGTGDEVTNTNTMLGLAQLDSRGRLGVRRIFDDKFMIADERWLRQLADVPGSYLKARIAFEAKARLAAGLSPPPPDDPR